MKVVINLDDEIAQGVIEGKNDEPRNIVRSFQATIADAIKNGTPLPKGHGRLIEADELLHRVYGYGEGQLRMYLIDPYFVKKAPTIIEADKGEEE